MQQKHKKLQDILIAYNIIGIGILPNERNVSLRQS